MEYLKTLRIQNLIDYILLNAYSVRSAGLYNGKAGLSLCLFELSRYWNNDQIEAHAFQLLRESLVLAEKGSNMSYKDGTAGVGFVLSYLIKNHFIKANFKDIFEKNVEKILSELKKATSYSESHLLLIYFLENVYCFNNRGIENYNHIHQILEKTTGILEEQFSNFKYLHTSSSKISVLSAFENYLKIIFYCENPLLSNSLIEKYIALYKEGYIPNSFSIGYYLDWIASILQNDNLKSIAQTNKRYALLNLHPDTFTLSLQINYLYLFNEDNEFYHEQICLLEKNLIEYTNTNIEKKILQKIQPNSFIAGYGEGISRLILYWIYKQNSINNLDCSRFKCLF
jgi:hypothetical protein